MAATDSYINLTKINIQEISATERLIIEAELFSRIYDEVLSFIASQQLAYLKLIRLNKDEAHNMIESNFICWLIQDIIDSGEYTIQGIASYTNTPDDAIYDIISGINKNPSMQFCRRLIEIHRTSRPALYSKILDKIKSDFLPAA